MQSTASTPLNTDQSYPHILQLVPYGFEIMIPFEVITLKNMNPLGHTYEVRLGVRAMHAKTFTLN